MNARDKEIWEKSQQWDSSDDGRGKLKILESVEKFAELVRAQPPQGTWVGLTDDEATALWEATDDKDSWELIKQVQAKLKEKNL